VVECRQAEGATCCAVPSRGHPSPCSDQQRASGLVQEYLNDNSQKKVGNKAELVTRVALHMLVSVRLISNASAARGACTVSMLAKSLALSFTTLLPQGTTAGQLAQSAGEKGRGGEGAAPGCSWDTATGRGARRAAAGVLEVAPSAS
jgi:hypothetical protein